jgi:hypothetical protein
MHRAIWLYLALEDSDKFRSVLCREYICVQEPNPQEEVLSGERYHR